MTSLAGLLPGAGVLPGPAAHPALPLPDPGGIVGGFVGGQLLDGVSALLRGVAGDFLTELAAPVTDYVLHTPDLLAEPTLQRLWLVSCAAALSCAGFLVAVAGLTVTAGSASRLGRSARHAVAVRLPACLLLGAVSLPVVALEVQLANRLVDALLSGTLQGGHDAVWLALDRTLHGDPAAGLAVLVTCTVGVVLLVTLVLVGLARWASLWLLVVLAPVGCVFALLPGGEPVVRVWWRLQLGTVFLPVADAVLLGSYVAMFSSRATGLLGALSGVAVLALLARLPRWLGGAVVGVEAHELTHRLRQSTRLVRPFRNGSPRGRR